MMYGSVETPEERIEHMMRLRELQDETHGFTAFITWSYQPDHTELAGVELTGVEYLRTLALARIVLDNFDNVQASWVTQGGKVGQLSLAFGANDMGSVMIEENVVRAAGASYCMDEVEIVRNIEDAGFAPMRRTMHYDLVGQPVFRERAVPRRLSLDVAKKDGAELHARRTGRLRGAQPRGARPPITAGVVAVLGRARRAGPTVVRFPVPPVPGPGHFQSPVMNRVAGVDCRHQCR